MNGDPSSPEVVEPVSSGHGVPGQRASAESAPTQSAPTHSAPTQSTPRRGRDQYIDGLRALALIRVMAYHTFGWLWLPVVFPSMSVMFALGGALVATSLSRAPGRHWSVLRKRVKRLLPPLWLYGTVIVTLMVARGWTVTETAGTPLTWSTALAWIVPFDDPPGSAWGYDFVLPLWYIRTYLWLLLLSPVMLWLFRRYPRSTFAVPAAALLVIAAGGLDTTTNTGDTVEHLATFGACWLLGFAHQDGRIRALPKARTVLAGAVLMALGLAYAFTHQQPDTSWDIDNIDVANALYGAGAVLVLLRLYPRSTFLERTPRLSALVSAMNARAMTIYLWGNVCIWLAVPLIESTPWTERLEVGGLAGQVSQFGVAWLVMGAAVLLFGWAEDVAAGRPARLNPWPRATRPSSAGAPARVHRLRRPGLLLGALGAAVVVTLVAAFVLTPGSRSASLVFEAPLVVAGASTDGTDAESRAGTPHGGGKVRSYPLHSDVLATVFRVGSITETGTGESGQSLTSAWDARWATHFGGCDGIGPVGQQCAADTDRRQAPDYWPVAMTPKQNPYYVGLPYNDLFTRKSVDRRSIPWAGDPGYAVRISDRSVSFLKNRWVAVTGPSSTCYAQVEDTGPGDQDPQYVLGSAAPQDRFGINLSPAVYRCIGLGPEEKDGQSVSWQFVDNPPTGPWTRLVTTRQVSS